MPPPNPDYHHPSQRAGIPLKQIQPPTPYNCLSSHLLKTHSQPLSCIHRIHSVTSIFISNFNIVVFMLSENIFESNELKKDLVNEGLFIMLTVVRIQSNEVLFQGFRNI